MLIDNVEILVKAGNGGLIQFFPEHLEVVKKYRSTTRLLRKE
jgi:hypothetical protein